jgi:hypothetical protein
MPNQLELILIVGLSVAMLGLVLHIARLNKRLKKLEDKPYTECA